MPISKFHSWVQVLRNNFVFSGVVCQFLEKLAEGYENILGNMKNNRVFECPPLRAGGGNGGTDFKISQ